MKYLVCNFKNKLSKEECMRYNRIIKDETFKLNLVIMPSFPNISIFDSNEYSLGAQDISSIIDEKVTGEVTGEQLKSFGCSYVLVGHSERREFKKEINIDFINKITNAQSSGLNVIYCIGETIQEKEAGKTYDVLEKQISEVLNNVELKNIIIAYEPVWAIGSGKVPTNSLLQNNIEYIKDIIDEKYEQDIKVLYGGSITLENITDITRIDAVDGFLVGGASLNPNNVIEMAKILENL